jgi:ABC-2 type transport system permease protein
MKAWLKLTWIDFKLTNRSLVVVFFTFAFPVLNILMFGSMYGNEPTPLFNGRGSADIMAPGYLAALAIGSSAFMNLPLEMASRRQMGVLRRFRASPLHPLAVLGSQVAVSIFVTLLSSALLIATGAVAFGAMLPVNPLALLAAVLLSCLSLYALSLLVSNFFHSVATARAVFMAFYFPMMFISGGTLPLQFLPDAVQKISRFLPLTYVVDLCKGVYLDARWDLTALGVLAGILILSTLLSVRSFRWE